MKLIIHCDGASRGNPGLAASAFVITDEKENEIFSYNKFIGINTNNVAEYYAILLAHQWLAKSKQHISSVDFILDSELAVKQLNKVYKVKSPNIMPYYKKINQLKLDLNYPISYLHVKRHKNKKADQLANDALDERAK